MGCWEEDELKRLAGAKGSPARAPNVPLRHREHARAGRKFVASRGAPALRDLLSQGRVSPMLRKPQPNDAGWAALRIRGRRFSE